MRQFHLVVVGQLGGSGICLVMEEDKSKYRFEVYRRRKLITCKTKRATSTKTGFNEMIESLATVHSCDSCPDTAMLQVLHPCREVSSAFASYNSRSPANESFKKCPRLGFNFCSAFAGATADIPWGTFIGA